MARYYGIASEVSQVVVLYHYAPLSTAYHIWRHEGRLSLGPRTETLVR
jgi:hypothetical protein